MWTYNYTNELYHTGVKGMKWGVRRYQKLEKTRNKEADYYKRASNSEKNSFETNKNFTKELKKQGHRGQLMKNMYGFTDDKTAMDRYGTTMKNLWQDELNNSNHQANLSKSRAQAYEKAYQRLKDLDVNTVRNRRDIVRLGKNTINDVFNEQSSEDEIYY